MFFSSFSDPTEILFKGCKMVNVLSTPFKVCYIVPCFNLDRCLIKIPVYLTRHAEDYETVFTVHGILGETPRRLYIRGQGSYDEKHEAILNV